MYESDEKFTIQFFNHNHLLCLLKAAIYTIDSLLCSIRPPVAMVSHDLFFRPGISQT